MGQKVHPISARLVLNRAWSSRWMMPDEKQYVVALHQDVKLRKAILKKFAHAYVTKVEIERSISTLKVIIYAVKPGMIIGRGGKGLEEVRKLINEIVGEQSLKDSKTKVDFVIEPVKKPYLNATYVGMEIMNKIVRGLPHRRVVHQATAKVMEAGAKGVKVQLGGRIGGASISRREKFFLGSVPLSTLRQAIDYADTPALTKSGYVGVKVWIALPEEE